MSTDPTEQEIAAVSTAPRVTQEAIEANIIGEIYFGGKEVLDGIDEDAPSDTSSACVGLYGPGSYKVKESLMTMTFCVLVLRNGFTVTGESVCASKENFDAEIGMKIARSNACEEIWKLEGYLLRDKLAERVGNR